MVKLEMCREEALCCIIALENKKRLFGWQSQPWPNYSRRWV